MVQALALLPESRHGVWFQSLFDLGRGYLFPCDAMGRVDLETLSGRLRQRYLDVESLVGREFATPVVRGPMPAQSS